jgi:malate dehydrogenase (oxaloacetate-decarboxylating)
MKMPGKKSLALHKKYKGKLETISKVPLENCDDLALAYTPGVGEVCKMVGRDGRFARDYTIKGNTVAVITDGSAVLGLGNIGPLAALPVMEGKAILLKKFADIDAFPICLNTQDVEKIIQTVKIIAPVFGAIQLEDISAPRCFEIEKRLQQELDIPVLHDDQHSTAVVVLAALINALKCVRYTPYTLPPTRLQIIINGAGAAGIGIARLLLAYGFKNLTILDSHGSIYRGRKGLTAEKLELAKKTNQKKLKGGLEICLKNADVFIGVSKAGLLKPAMVKSMNQNPIIFALANPTPEIMPDLAKKAGAFIIATGRSDFPNQINNVLSFPGIFRGALDNRVRIITQPMLIKVATNLAALVINPNPTKILPSLFDKKVVSTVAKAIN